MRILTWLLCGAGLASSLASAAPVGTAFTYQGSLRNGGAPANGSFDFQFCLFAASAGGSTLGCASIADNVTVADGRFTTRLDFGAVFDGEQKFVQIGVRDGASGGAFTVLSPRQELTAAPYAQMALGVATVPQRRYYQTSAQSTGANALTACATGFHMATLSEIFNTASLRYDSTITGSAASADSGPSGAPYGITGWIRTGGASSVANTVGLGNCSLWTSSAAGNFGTVLVLDASWLGAAPSNISPWNAVTAACSLNRRVWCVED